MSTAVGEKVKDFTLPNQKGDAIQLSQALENGPVVLAFFPLAFTGVCTEEMCEFRDSLKSFEDLKSTVFGISVDSRFTLGVFAEQQNLNFDLLSDFNKDVAGDFDVLYKEFHGMRGVAKRSVVVVNPDLTVAYRWVSEDASVKPDLEEIKKALRA